MTDNPILIYSNPDIYYVKNPLHQKLLDISTTSYIFVNTGDGSHGQPDVNDNEISYSVGGFQAGLDSADDYKPILEHFNDVDGWEIINEAVTNCIENGGSLVFHQPSEEGINSIAALIVYAIKYAETLTELDSYDMEETDSDDSEIKIDPKTEDILKLVKDKLPQVSINSDIKYKPLYEIMSF